MPLPSPPSTPAAPAWKTGVEELIAQVHRQITTLSLGQQPRIAVDLPGRAPILLDRWEFEAFSGKSKESEQMRKAVAIRSLSREMRLACESLPTLAPTDVPVLLQVIPRTIRLADDVSHYFTRLAESGDSAQARRSHLTRDNMNREVDALVKAFETTGNIFKRGEARENADEAVPSPAAASSLSGAHARVPIESDPGWKKALVPLLFLLGAAIAVFNLMPGRSRAKPIDAAVFRDIAPLARAWSLDGTVCGEVTAEWYAAAEERQRELARKMFERAKKEHQATRLALYQPGGTFLAATVSDTEENIKPRFRY